MPSAFTVLGLTAATTLAAGVLTHVPATAATPTCFGEPATITGSSTRESVVHGTDGPDVIVAEGEVHAGGGDDLVCGAVIVHGGDGNDRIRFVGADGVEGELSGGAGRDELIWRSPTWADLIGGPGADTLKAGRAAQLLSGEGGSDRLFGGPGADMLNGFTGADRLHGGDGNDDLSGRGGDDRVFGDEGNDSLTGGSGIDHGVGGPGDDTCEGFHTGVC